MNVFWAFVFFASALVIAAMIGLKLSGRRRIALLGVAVLVALGVGFSMMAQFWLDYERTGVLVTEVLESVSSDMADARIDRICRTAMTTTPAITAVAGDNNARVLDQISYSFDTHPVQRCSFYGPEHYRDWLKGATVTYAVPARQSDPTRSNAGNVAEDRNTNGGSSRLYFELRPDPWRLVRVYQKELRGSTLIDVTVWDEGLGRE